ncbi:hypothetical protein FIV42_02260 [Persicimonas caeni]|uniref:Invasin domain-containing protein n=1 Tax=Persicimonas caeni TaxID=2292766 RepID=A0A4Y6PMT7_PERCE|nr:MopE-related protein [Persicimonas caeni]QDG49602.1 hypothetical protein FIV42_02260 [Persicimonas caeni]QED30823.1 hypothetical protein FRD00_02255 [Persicimonas caeni]
MDSWLAQFAVGRNGRQWLVVFVGVVALTLSSCSFDGTAQSPVTDEDAGDVADVFDALGDATDSGDSGDVDDAADSGDAGSDYGEPCSSNADCASGYCYPGPDGDVCTVECTDDAACGDGWICEPLQNDPSTSLCFPDAPLCTDTCTVDADCPGSDSNCIPHPDGNFCSRPCNLRSCPDGYECTMSRSVDDQAGRQCIPTSTVCADCFDEDGDGYGIGDSCTDTDCDDGDDTAYPGAAELCDGVDNNCDDTVDEGCDCANGDTQSCYSGPSGTQGVGKCAVGTQTCSGGGWGTCENEVTPDSDETCGDGVDNDCDGTVDQGCGCDFNSSSEGVCANGQIDDAGNCSAPASYEASEASCDGLDNDCDGVIDEGCACDFNGSTDGVCAGSTIDANGTCQQPANYEATETSCDGFDNDCDGQSDEGCGCNYNGVAVGVCSGGNVGPNGCEAPSTYEATETSCDTLDNDCDGVVDEGCACDFNGSTDGVCAGSTIGANGTCQQPADYEATETSCDGLDNDCDGVADVGCQCDYNGASDGVCSGGTIDSTGTCQAPSDYSSTELCDGVDNNCDGQTDEGCTCQNGATQSCYSGPSGTAGVGECQSGTQTCSSGNWGSCSNEITPGTETCDGVDNDCDGQTDEGCQCDYNGTSTGVCSAGTDDGTGSCQAPSSYEATEASCDGLDNDCDGQVDEGCGCNYNGSAVGVCSSGSSDGNGGCQAPSTYEASETSCDGLDNDCDGVVDEGCPCDYNGSSNGVCATATRDANGNCQQPVDYMSDESGSTCDGLDNDCDGQADESCCSGVDTSSAITATSGCLTSGTNAESAIVLDLVDANGNPISGANVTMTTSAGTLSTVSSSGNTYWATLTPPSSSGVASATVTVSVDDSCSGQAVQMATQVSVAFASPMTDTDGGAGGCATDGNVRVRVVKSEDGTAIANAHVMIGQTENTSAYTTSYGGAANGANTGTTDANGYVEFKDFASALDAPVTVTAGATGRAYMTMVDIDASDLVLPLEEVYPATATRKYDGDFTSVSTGGDLDVGFMLGDVTIDQIMDFNLSTLLADNVCYQSGNGLVGSMNLPDNVYIPDQYLGLFVGSVNKKSYGSAPLEYGDRYLTGISGESTLSDASSGDIVQILQTLDFQKIGSRAETVDGNSTTSGVDIDMTNTLTDNVTCNVSNAPSDSDVFCLTAGDWDSKNDANLALGAGRLFLMGLRIGTASQTSFTIDNVSTVAASGMFTDIEYMGASVAAYVNDPTAAPAGTENGASIVARRDPSLIDGTGGTLNFDDYIPIRPLTLNGRQLSAQTLAGGAYPNPHYTRSTIRQKITELYSGCGTDDSERTIYHTLWTVYTDGATDAYTLPTLPSGWPRAADGGFVDVASTPEDDVINWMHMSLHEGLNTGFDFDAIRFGNLRDSVTHASVNNTDG